MAQFVKITSMGDDVCPTCEDLDGEVVTRQYWRSHTHPSCKCIATPATKKDMTKKERAVAAKLKKKKKKANNMDVVEEEVQATEVQSQMQDVVEQKQINEDGTVDVQVAVTGTIVGSDKEGQPIEQQITEEALSGIAEALNAENKEVLVDRDHQSAREGLDRDTHAMGWLSRFWANTKGLFAKLRLTPTGKALVEGREYRKLSPVFTLDKDGKPLTLESAAFTNTPAMECIEPILNQKPKEGFTMEITKEDLVTLIKETVAAMNQAPAEDKPAEQQDKPVEEAKAEETKVEETTEQQVEEAKDECGNKDVVVDETAKPEDKPEDTPVEQQGKPAEAPATPAAKAVEEAQKKEVVTLEALNSAPQVKAGMDISGKSAWEKLHGEEFFKWLKQNH